MYLTTNKMNSQTSCIVLSLTMILVLFSTLPRGQSFFNSTQLMPLRPLVGETKDWNLSIGKLTTDHAYKMICPAVLTRCNRVMTSASCLIANGIFPLQKTWTNMRILHGGDNFYNIVAIHFHPKFVEDSNSDDIAWLEANTVVNASTPQPPNLFNTEEIFNHPEDQLVTNWTLATADDSSVPNLLKTTMITAKICEGIYKAYMKKRGRNFHDIFPRGIDSTLLCAKVKSAKECEKQSGTHLIAERIHTIVDKNITLSYLLGIRTKDITRGATNCVSRSLPMVFTDVSRYNDFVGC